METESFELLYWDGDLQLVKYNGETYLHVGEQMYKVTSSPYEPCLYLEAEDGTCITIHNAITVIEFCRLAEENDSTLMITGNRYDIQGVCRLLRKALTLWKSVDMTYLEECCFLDYLAEHGAISEETAISLKGSVIRNPHMLNSFLHCKKIYRTDDGRYYSGNPNNRRG